AFDEPPPGAGLKTVTCAVPALATSLAGICAVNCVALTKAVCRSAPFQRTIAPLTKLVPVTVKLKAALPACAAFGFELASGGVGLGCVIVKVAGLDEPPPGAGLRTTMETVPALATSLAGTWIVSVVALIKLVSRSAPFHQTEEALRKPVPVIVSVKLALPAT